MSLTYNTTLTNYGRGIAIDKASAIAGFLAPDVPVGVSSGQYKAFNDGNAFQIVDTRRAIGGEATRLEFGADDPTFNCTPHALEIPIDMSEREKYGEGDPLGIERAKTATLVSSAVLSHEARVIAAAKTLAAVSGKGTDWTKGTGDPLSEIDEQIEAIATAIQQLPNRLLIGLPLWRILRNHPKVLARFPGAQSVGVSIQQFQSLLLNPAIEIRIGVLAAGTEKQPKSPTKTNMVGSDLFIFKAEQSPTQFDCSFMKTFRTRTGGIDAVRTYQTASGRADILAVDWSEDIKVTGLAAARRITAS